MADKVDFTALLPVLEAKRAALDTLIASLRTALSVGALGQVGDEIEPFQGAGVSAATGLPIGPVDLPTGAFLGKSIPAAIKLYLTAARRKQTIREIATALREGGVESTASNFEGTVTGALNRLKTAGEVLRFKDGWALAEFYPEHIRKGIAENGGRPKKGAKKRKGVKGKAKAVAPKAAKEDGISARVVGFLRQRGTPASTGDVAAALGAAGNVVGLILGRLKKDGRVVRGADGQFSLAS